MAISKKSRTPNEAPIYFLIGGAGVPNFGDELIVDHWLKWLRGLPQFGEHKIVSELNHHRVGASMGFDQYRDVYPSGDISHLRRNIPKNFSEAFDRGYAFFRGKDSSDVHKRVEDRLKRSSVYHLHGGGYLNGYWPFHAFSLGLGCAVKEELSTTVIATGIGLGPFESDESTSRVRSAVDAFDLFEVRDEISASYTGDGAVLGLDDAFVESVSSTPVRGKALHLALIDKTPADPMLRSLPRETVLSFDRVYFWICNPQDAQNYAALSSVYRHIVPLTPNRLLESIPVGTQNFMLTERFHPHLIGARLGFAGAFISRSGYYDAKHNSVTSLGSQFVPLSLGDDLSGFINSSADSSRMAKEDRSRVGKKNNLVGQYLG